MAKVTSKLQVTLPKALAERYGIDPGDDIDWEAAGDAIRVVPARKRVARDVAFRLKLFDEATARHHSRQQYAPSAAEGRGWTREQLRRRST